MATLPTLTRPVLAALLVALGPVPAAAYKPPRAKLIPVSELVVRKVIACDRAVSRAEDQATGNRSTVYKNRARLRDAALARCGFPKGVVWRDARRSVQVAAGDLTEEGPFEEPRAANRAAAAQLKAQLDRLFSE